MLSLGELYLNNFLKYGQRPGIKHELNLVMDPLCGAARLETPVPPEKMFGKYWYRSGTNCTMISALKDVVDSTLDMIRYRTTKPQRNWLDIACNDGTLLKFVPEEEFVKYGVDPCEFGILKHAALQGHIEQQYFSKDVFPGVFFDVITTVGMFYDLDDPYHFCRQVAEVLKKGGLWVIQMSYTPLMMKQMAFDNICHEHVYYHTVSSMKKILASQGLEILDCTLNDTNGGSFRLFVGHTGSKIGTQQEQDVRDLRVQSLIDTESMMLIDQEHTWIAWFQKVLALKDTVMTFLEAEKAKGKTIMGYGASTKGNTLLQFFGIDSLILTAIAERQEKKWGLYTPNGIPIISEEKMRENQPDYLLVLPWQFIGEFEQRERAYLEAGGKIIVCMPQFKIIQKWKDAEPKSNLKSSVKSNSI